MRLRNDVLITAGGSGTEGTVARVLVDNVGSDHAPIPATLPPRVRKVYKKPGFKFGYSTATKIWVSLLDLSRYYVAEIPLRTAKKYSYPTYLKNGLRTQLM